MILEDRDSHKSWPLQKGSEEQKEEGRGKAKDQEGEELDREEEGRTGSGWERGGSEATSERELGREGEGKGGGREQAGTRGRGEMKWG